MNDIISIMDDKNPKKLKENTIENLKLAIRYDTKPVAITDCIFGVNAVEMALKFASSFNRPIRFVRWGYEVQKLSLLDIIERNITKFFEEGEYTSTSVLMTFHKKGEIEMKSKFSTHIDSA